MGADVFARVVMRSYRRSRALSTRFALAAASLALGGCSLTFPLGLGGAAKDPEPVVMTTGSLKPGPARSPADALMADRLGPEDLRRAYGAMALALDPQGNGAPVSWDNGESKSSGRFTPVGGPFLRDHEVCRAFLSHVRTHMEQNQLQGTACRPSGGEWSIRDLKPWKQPG